MVCGGSLCSLIISVPSEARDIRTCGDKCILMTGRACMLRSLMLRLPRCSCAFMAHVACVVLSTGPALRLGLDRTGPQRKCSKVIGTTLAV
ncbi:hypothetical protein NDU88_002740 [Pleurodeles waltl]|uniref:Secreted protein n=1 Tax=Pleurodeles waltl TaxID=8319 RepID=A0AAV7WR16_PLEWA|nr:hypothetical protein NDU88_002740 [Pleurodeles waltl]